ncbi:MAG: hypothetical protein ACPGWR_11280 [Ardenticatenaceae bacterium]
MFYQKMNKLTRRVLPKDEQAGCVFYQKMNKLTRRVLPRMNKPRVKASCG